MPTTIEVNKQSVEMLLGSGKSKPFVIPEYQRPYAWTEEQVETLFLGFMGIYYYKWRCGKRKLLFSGECGFLRK